LSIKPKTAVNIGGSLVIRNPVMTASGTFGYGREYSSLLDLKSLGALVVKGLSLHPRGGNRPPRIAETPAGMLNAIGLQNVGVKNFVAEKLPFLRGFDVPVIANIYGETLEEFEEVAGILNAAGGVSALEVNISCPNVKKGGLAFGAETDTAREVTKVVRSTTNLPVIVKLSPNVSDITKIALAVEEGGADAISLINTIKAMAVDVEKRIPLLGNTTGGLSGPAIRPVAVRMVWEVVRCVEVPVIGIGGIVSARDALEFLIVGAQALQVGTANFLDPQSAVKIVSGIEDYLEKHSLNDIAELIGSLQVPE